MKLPSTLQTRLIISHLIVSLASIIAVAAFAGNSIFVSARQDMHNRLEDLAFVASNNLENPMFLLVTEQSDQSLVQQRLDRMMAIHPEVYYAVFLVDGTPLLAKGNQSIPLADANNAPEVIQALQDERGEGEFMRSSESGDHFFVAVRIQREGQVLGALQLGVALAPEMEPARRSIALLILVSLLVALGVTGFGWLLARNIVRPIRGLTQVAEQLASGDLSARVNPTGPQELHRLAVAFNIMAVRLQDHVDELRAFVANASHELRTPLTVVKLRTEALRDGALQEHAVAEQFLAEIESEVDRLGQMVNDLLDLSRMEAGLASKQRSILNMAVMATEVYETFSIRASRAGIDFQTHVEAGLPAIFGNEDQLRRVFYNLVDNAVKYTPAGGSVDLIVESGNQGRTVRLLITDSGPGIAPEHLSHIFERFYRVEATRPRFGSSRGSGLGLAIAKSIVENHGGKIGVSSQLGRGTTFWAELPAHRPEAVTVASNSRHRG
jgi:signal transduction histidine kinase